jgi:hypothetical protein
MKAWVLAGCVFGALLCACNEQEPPAQPSSFDRPTRVAFACFNLTDPEIPRVASLDRCDLDQSTAASGDVITHALHALVVQSSRGEVAAVDLLNRRTLDSRRDIPGYTFLPVGELPTAVVVPTTDARHAAFTYVANAGSRDITVLKTQAFRELGAKESPTVQTMPLPGGSRDAPFDMVLSPAEDALFVSIPNTGRVLRVPIQRCDGSGTPAPIDAGGTPISDGGLESGVSEADGGDAALPMTSEPGLGDATPSEPRPCAEGELDPDGITEIPVGESVALSAMDSSPDVPRDMYAKTCDYSGLISNASLPLPELPADVAQTQPKPSGMAVDNFCEVEPTADATSPRPCRQRLLIADSALPLIHVVDLVAPIAAVQTPIRTGVPTTSVVVTPRVPVDPSAESAETQYVYAIDATDGSVLVTENGRLLQVGADGARPDRVSLGGGDTLPVAVSISVMTPAFKVHGPANQHAIPADEPLPQPGEGNFCTDAAHELRSNLRLRGVFVSVGVADGSVRVVDIADMDLAECRSCEKYKPDCTSCKPTTLGNRCDACADKNWDPYPVVRHRTRIAATADRTVDTLPRLAPIARPAFAVSGNLVVVRATGTTSDPLIKGLECVPCGEGQVLAFPLEDTVGSQADAGAPQPDAGAPDADVPDADVSDADVPKSDAGADDDIDSPDPTSAPCRAGEARVCAQNDPWTELDDWIAVYQGAIPGSRGGDGRLLETDGRIELQVEGRFCALGVLGADQLETKVGDRLNVVGPLAPDSAIAAAEPHARDENSSAARTFESDTLAACKTLVSDRDNVDSPVPIAFAIQEAYADRLVLSRNLVKRPAGLAAEFENDAQFVRKCFGGMPLTYQVRVGSGYVVLGANRAGFLHRVRAEEGTGHCVQDSLQDPRRTGRALEGAPFDNGYVTFQIRGGGPPKLDTTLALSLTATTPKTVVNASISVNQQVVASIPVDLRWSESDDTLYMVDIASRGLVQIPVDPWPIGGVSRFFQ